MRSLLYYYVKRKLTRVSIPSVSRDGACNICALTYVRRARNVIKHDNNSSGIPQTPRSDRSQLSDKSELIPLMLASLELLASRTHTAVYISPHLFAGNCKNPLHSLQLLLLRHNFIKTLQASPRFSSSRIKEILWNRWFLKFDSSSN